MAMPAEIFTYVGTFDRIYVLLNHGYTPEFNPTIGQIAVRALRDAGKMRHGETTVAIFASQPDGTRTWAIYNGWIDEHAAPVVPTLKQMKEIGKAFLTVKRRRDRPHMAVWVEPNADTGFRTSFSYTILPGRPVDAEYMTLHDLSVPIHDDSIGCDVFLAIHKGREIEMQSATSA